MFFVIWNFFLKNDGAIAVLWYYNYIMVREFSGQIGGRLTTVTKHIRVLKEKGVIERSGSKKNGQWIVKVEVL